MFEEFWGQTLDPKRGLTVVEIMNAIHAGEIQGMYIEGENPAMSDPDLQHARQALAKLDHLVVQDLFLTETAFHADVVLPASAFAEKVGTFTNTDRRVQMAAPVVEPPGDARQDWWIIQEIGKRMGLRWTYAGTRATSSPRWRRYAVAATTSPGSGWSAKARSPIRSTRRTSPATRSSSRTGFPTDERARQDRAGRVIAAGRSAGRGIPDGALDRPRAGALAYGLDDPPRRRARRARAGGGRLHVAPATCDGSASRPGDMIRLETRRGAVE